MKTFLLLFFISFATASFAQVGITPDNTFAVCPDIQISYTAYISGSSCSFDWVITGGTFAGGGTTSSANPVTVTWSSTATSGTLKATSSGCGVSSTFGFAIKSLAGAALSSITGPATVTVNATASLRYKVDLIQYPKGSSDPDPYFVRDYVWTVPSGWAITNTGIDVTNQYAFADVTPDACSGGIVKVKAKSDCGNYYSNEKTYTVTRTLSAPGSITGPTSVICSDVATKTYSIAAVTGATSYTWSLPAGWSGSSTSTSITVTPNGYNGGTISVTANGCSLQSAASTLAVGIILTNPNSTPSVSGSSLVCFSGEAFTLTNLPANSTVSWSQSSNLTTISGQGATIYTVRANDGSTNGSGWVEAAVTTPCGTVPPIRYNVWVGPPGADMSTLIYLGTRGVNPVSTSPSSTYYFQVDAVSSASLYTWIVPWLGNPKNGNTAATFTGAANAIYLATPSSTGTYALYCTANNTCGSNYTNSLTINNVSGGGGGGSPQMVALSTSSSLAVAVYPNPTSSMLVVQVIDSLDTNLSIDKLDEPYELHLIDKSQKKVISIQSSDKTLHISTENLPAEIYYLQVYYKKALLRKQIRISK